MRWLDGISISNMASEFTHWKSNEVRRHKSNPRSTQCKTVATIYMLLLNEIKNLFSQMHWSHFQCSITVGYVMNSAIKYFRQVLIF